MWLVRDSLRAVRLARVFKSAETVSYFQDAEYLRWDIQVGGREATTIMINMVISLE